jgi:hypothetical protein
MNKKIERRAINLLKAINSLDKVGLKKTDNIVDHLSQILSDQTLRLSYEFGYSSREINNVLLKAGN